MRGTSFNLPLKSIEVTKETERESSPSSSHCSTSRCPQRLVRKWCYWQKLCWCAVSRFSPNSAWLKVRKSLSLWAKAELYWCGVDTRQNELPACNVACAHAASRISGHSEPWWPRLRVSIVMPDLLHACVAQDENVKKIIVVRFNCL